MEDVAVIGIDIGKTTFHLVAVDASGAIQWKKKHSRAPPLGTFAHLPGALTH